MLYQDMARICSKLTTKTPERRQWRRKNLQMLLGIENVHIFLSSNVTYNTRNLKSYFTSSDCLFSINAGCG